METDYGRQRAVGAAIGGALPSGLSDLRGQSAPATVGPGISGQIERLDQVVSQVHSTLENAALLLKHVDDMCGYICGAAEPSPLHAPAAQNRQGSSPPEPNTLVTRLSLRNLQLEEALQTIQITHEAIQRRLVTIKDHL